MPGRRLAAAVVALGSALGAAALWRRRSVGREHVEAYFADGSMLTFAEGTEEAARLLPIARRALFQARG